MELLVVLLAAAAVAVFFIKGALSEKRKEKRIREEIHAAYGREWSRKYTEEELSGICGFYEAHQKADQVDDITWNDLGMDELFFRMNHTYSSAGQEYLYYALRTPALTAEETAGRKERIAWFAEHEREREELQTLFYRLGRSGKYSIYDYLMYLDRLEDKSPIGSVLKDVLLVGAAFLIPFSPSVGMAFLFTLLTVNMFSYMKQKRETEPYLVSFAYVRRILDFSERLRKVEVPLLKEEWSELEQLGRQFGRFRSSAVLGMRGSSMAGDPLSILMDYLNMILHLDLIAFHFMLREVKGHLGQIDRMVELAGRTECDIAIASYRQSLGEGWCCPEFVSPSSPGMADGGGISLKGMYHPLLTSPVKNDIGAKRGVLVTGSNASGKSTFLKAVALNALLAQTVHTCAAQEYRGHLYRIFTSMSLRDDLESGESYYMVEIRALKRILDAAGKEGAPVLCFVDEVLRGTNTVERIAASARILESLCPPGVLCFAATHDIELTELLKDSYDNYHFEERVEDEDIRFNYILMPGRAATRNAIKLLSLMGYPASIIEEADRMAARFTETGEWEMQAHQSMR